MQSPEDDDAWLEALRGTPRPGTDPATLAEAGSVRRAILEAKTDAAPDEVSDGAGLQRLMFRLRREGLLQGSGSSGRWKVPTAAVAALFVGVALSFTLLQRGGEEQNDDTQLRGGASTQVLRSDDVGGTVSVLEAALRTAGATVAINDVDGGGKEVAASIPPARLAEVRKSLSALGLKPPQANGSLRVEIRPR